VPEFIPCSSCGRHLDASAKCCPHCSTSVRPGRTAAAALVGLALVAGACDKGSYETDYGVPMDSGAADDTGDTGDSED
jgi:hypothetical protein